MEQDQQRQSVTSSSIFNQTKHVSSASQSKYTFSHQGMCSSGSSMITSSQSSKVTNGHYRIDDENSLEDLEKLTSSSSSIDVDRAISKYSHLLNVNVQSLARTNERTEVSTVLDSINLIIQKAWAVPMHGHHVGHSLCNQLRVNGGLDFLVQSCVMDFSSARLLEQCLTTENRAHVVNIGLEKVVNGACVCTKNLETDHSRVGTGILEHLFKHNEGTCSDVIRLGGLDAVLFECRKNDVETLRHCAMALTNLSLYGGARNQEAMITRKAHSWLFPLAFHHDHDIKYYACLATAVLLANEETEAEVSKSGTLALVKRFITSHEPSVFVKSNLADAHGQSKHWLERLVPVLSSSREEARNMAAFHFCMEAAIKKEQRTTEIFRDIGAIEPLKTVASCPNPVASEFAAQALLLMGEDVPHRLSKKVPLWSVDDVRVWVKQIGFHEYERNFHQLQVDGKLLLELNEKSLREDIGITNGISRRRFILELEKLKKITNYYSSENVAHINDFLQSIDPEYTTYTYAMLNGGVNKNRLKNLTDDQLREECCITNSIHRNHILDAIKIMENPIQQTVQQNMSKTLDVFVSYRRSNGSQLASLLKIHLEMRGFSVFIDVEGLMAGRFDYCLLKTIREAEHFVLVLTSSALDRCMEDVEGKDWIHREIVAALNSNCNIIPITENFTWPEAEKLPENIRSVCHLNSVLWIHDYQDACVNKVERFMRSEREQRLANAAYGSLRGGPKSSIPNTVSTMKRENGSNRIRSNTRRTSAPAIVTQRTPLPSNIGNRSQSLHELLDSSVDTPAPERASEQNAPVASGASESSKSDSPPNPHPDNANENEDNLIDTTNDAPPRGPCRSEHAPNFSVECDRNPKKSKEAETSGLDRNETASIGSTNSLIPSRPSPSNQVDETRSTNIQDDTKSKCKSMTSSQHDDSIWLEGSEKKRNFLNRYVKQVKSFIKK